MKKFYALLAALAAFAPVALLLLNQAMKIVV
jgi:hypothetical protein